MKTESEIVTRILSFKERIQFLEKEGSNYSLMLVEKYKEQLQSLKWVLNCAY